MKKYRSQMMIKRRLPSVGSQHLKKTEPDENKWVKQYKESGVRHSAFTFQGEIRDLNTNNCRDDIRPTVLTIVCNIMLMLESRCIPGSGGRFS